MNGIDLLNEYRERRSEQAFGELVRRYTNLVYSVAKRRLGSQTLAQDASQTVFVRLAGCPPALRREAELSAWLHRTTVHVSIDLWRSESRRRAREEYAAAMQIIPSNDPSWTDIAPALDEALNELNEPDRQAILLRFFNQQPMRELGSAFGISEDAAKMRVSRALDRLRDQLGIRGVTCPAIALSAFLTEQSVEAAPSEVAAAIAGAEYLMAQGATAAMAGGTGLLGSLSLAKLGGGVAALAIVGAGAWYLMHHSEPGQSNAPGLAATGAVAPGQGLNVAAPIEQNAAASTESNLPDPAQLLRAAARARQRITSGYMAFQVDSFGVGATFYATNRLRVTAVFDGDQRRFEQFGREYSYTYDSDPVRQKEIQTKAEAYGFDKEGAIRAGLLSGFESHHVTAYDGTTLMDYWENDGKPFQVELKDPSKGGFSYVFDPRCFGLESSFSYPQTTVEQCLWLDRAGAAQLLGKETVDGLEAWHLQMPGTAALDIWLDAARPTRVLKKQAGASVIVSRYEPGNSADALPKEVVRTYFVDGKVQSQARFVRTAAQLNIPVEPVNFTLQGLGMKIGTPVIDLRIQRRLGYWTGAGLSENPPSKRASMDEDKPTVEEMLEILDNVDPAWPVAFDAAQWILLNSPDGPAVERAAGVILRHHVRSSELLSICREMDRMRHRCAVELLETVLKENPHDDVRATACFTLATLAKDESKYGEDKKLAARAEAFFDRVAAQEFSKAGLLGLDLSIKAKTQLSELRRLSIGKTAPDFEATSLDGRRIRLRDYRGKVVIVTFWGHTEISRVEEHFRLLEPLTRANKPVAWIGIYCSDDSSKAAARLEKYESPWPIIHDGNHGPIASDWVVRSWPSIFVLDRSGIIRARDDREKPLASTIAELLGE